VRRIGKVVREQVGLYSTLTGARPAPAGEQPEPEPAQPDQDLAEVLEMPRRKRPEAGEAGGEA
jgi:hypothetical protein